MTYQNILVVGDSIAKGIVFDEMRNRFTLLKDSFFNIMQSKLTASLDNISRLGNTIFAVKDALFKKLTSGSKPDVVLLEVGGNDCDFNWEQVAAHPNFDHQPNTDIEVYQNELFEIIRSLRTQDIIPLMLNLPPIDADRYFMHFTHGDPEMGKNVLKWLGDVSKIYWWHERYNSAAENIAETTGTRLVNIRHQFLKQPDFRLFIGPDGIHPNARGHQLIAAALDEFIKINSPELFKPDLI